jgi:hypothetical protein
MHVELIAIPAWLALNAVVFLMAGLHAWRRRRRERTAAARMAPPPEAAVETMPSLAARR